MGLCVVVVYVCEVNLAFRVATLVHDFSKHISSHLIEWDDMLRSCTKELLLLTGIYVLTDSL